MESIREALSRGVEQLLGRAGGPLHFRLFFMPLVAAFLAVRAGMKDAREGRPAFLWAVFTNSAERPRLLRSAVTDVGRIFLVAVVLDTTYQLLVLRAFYPAQVLIIAVACALMPYVVIRGPVTRLTRGLYRDRSRHREEMPRSRATELEEPTAPPERPGTPPDLSRAPGAKVDSPGVADGKHVAREPMKNSGAETKSAAGLRPAVISRPTHPHP